MEKYQVRVTSVKSVTEASRGCHRLRARASDALIGSVGRIGHTVCNAALQKRQLLERHSCSGSNYPGGHLPALLLRSMQPPPNPSIHPKLAPINPTWIFNLAQSAIDSIFLSLTVWYTPKRLFNLTKRQCQTDIIHHSDVQFLFKTRFKRPSSVLFILLYIALRT